MKKNKNFFLFFFFLNFSHFSLVSEIEKAKEKRIGKMNENRR